MEADEAKLVIDSTIATGAITMPLWVTELQGWIGFAIAVGGLVLVVIRIIIAIRDYLPNTLNKLRKTKYTPKHIYVK